MWEKLKKFLAFNRHICKNLFLQIMYLKIRDKNGKKKISKWKIINALIIFLHLNVYIQVKYKLKNFTNKNITNIYQMGKNRKNEFVFLLTG